MRHASGTTILARIAGSELVQIGPAVRSVRFGPLTARSGAVPHLERSTFGISIITEGNGPGNLSLRSALAFNGALAGI
jgi:hypothetical protein